MPKATKKATPRRRAAATPPPYSFAEAVSASLTAHPDAAIFAAVAEYTAAWEVAIALHEHARAAAQFGDMPRGGQEAGRRALAAEKRLVDLAPTTTTPEGVMALQQAALGSLPSCGGMHAVARAAIQAAVMVGF